MVELLVAFIMHINIISIEWSARNICTGTAQEVCRLASLVVSVEGCEYFVSLLSLTSVY